jgi:glycosyl transferase family 2
VSESGISVVILSYERPGALADLLRALIAQQLGGLSLEVLLCNNSPAVRIEPRPGSEVGDLLGALADVKVFNSSHNWLCRVRYTLATLARHDTIFFIDDDLSPTDPHVVRDLYDALARLGSFDIVSCWTALWTEWNERSLTKVRMGFTRPAPAELTECDYVGPGISMFRKRLVLHPAILDLPPERWRSDSSWFPWVTAMELGTRKYYVPTHGRFRIHPENRHAALNDTPGFRTELYAAYKEMWKRGYEPVLGRTRNSPAADSPERRAARELPTETDLW